MEQKIYVWGDSIAKGVVLAEGSRYQVLPTCCTSILQADGLRLEPHTCMGATIRVGLMHFSGTVTEPGSIAVIEYGGNDCDLDWDAVAAHPEIFHDGRIPIEEFKALLRLFIQGAREREMMPLTVVPPPLDAERYLRWVSRGRDQDAILRYLRDAQHIYRWQERYTRALEDVSKELDCQILDLRTPFLDAPDFQSLICLDGIHPNAAGQALMARVVMENIRQGRLLK